MRTIIRYIVEGRIYLLSLLLIIGLIAGLLVHIGSPVGGDKRPVIVSVPKGVSSSELGTLLAEKHLVRSAMGFSLVARLTGDSRKLKAGVYALNRGMDVGRIIDIIVSGKTSGAVVVIPEGFTISEIADRLARQAHIDGARFRSLATGDAASFSSVLNVPAPGLEGYLFPATYEVGFGESPRTVIEEMLGAFRTNVGKLEEGEAISADRMHQIVTVASMVEEEAKMPKDRPLIAAVIWNRIGLGMRLEIDATVEYALGEHRSRLFYRDLEVESPYNTYRRAGLPPGPIANPGVSSIEAAMHPAAVNYLYYVAKPDGSHIFSTTLEDHNAAKQRMKQLRSDAGQASLPQPNERQS